MQHLSRSNSCFAKPVTLPYALLLPMADVEHSYAGEMTTLSPGHRQQSTRGIYDELTGDDK
jgi:hypothetical protein